MKNSKQNSRPPGGLEPGGFPDGTASANNEPDMANSMKGMSKSSLKDGYDRVTIDEPTMIPQHTGYMPFM